jgi:hypothetical protein
MDLSTTANIMQVISFIGGTVAVLYKLFKITKKRILSANDAANNGKELVARLIANATSAERRADIHTFIQVRSIEIEGRRTRGKIELFFLFTIGLCIGLASVYTAQKPEINLSLTQNLITIAFNIIPLIGLGMLLISERNVQKIEDGWRQGVQEALGLKIDKHLSR